MLKPVLLAPLQREWDEVKRKCEEQLWPKLVKTVKAKGKAARSATARRSAERKAFDRAILDFAERLHHVTVLDPACGSGNFLYVAIHVLLDLEKEVVTYAASRGLSLVPQVNPSQLHGLEINPYAQQLAQVVIWIGYLQWMHHNGFKMPDHPVLAPIETVRCMDAILDLSDPEHPKEPEWPEAEFIVGNPPFLGDKLMRGGLGDDYVDSLRKLYDGRVPGGADLCCYWFEKGRQSIEDKRSKRVGLLATQGIRGGVNREVLKRIKAAGDIFFAESDRDWILDGANVHISMVGFDDGAEHSRVLDSKPVSAIDAQLAAGSNLCDTCKLKQNAGLGFIGVAQKAPFDIDDEIAKQFLLEQNPHGRPNSDVLRPICNAFDITRRYRFTWNVDFGLDMLLEEAAKYEAPFEYIKKVVYPQRVKHREVRQVKYWWLFARPCPDMRRGLGGLPRFAATPRVSKHRLFVWLPPELLCDSAVVAYARSDDCFFGVLHSRIHEVWALRMGTQLETRPRYTPTSCFETFPLPECVLATGGPHPNPLPKGEGTKCRVRETHHPRGKEEVRFTHPTAEAIAAAAKELDALRNNWLNPPEWTKTEVLEFPRLGRWPVGTVH